MPAYDYRCGECGEAFTLSRPMAESSEPAVCPNGHPGAKRKMSFQGSTHNLTARTVPPGKVSRKTVRPEAVIPNYHGDPSKHDHDDHAPGKLHDHSHGDDEPGDARSDRDHSHDGDHAHDDHGHDHDHGHSHDHDH
jgi:putative FmdB family regulatory protein